MPQTLCNSTRLDPVLGMLSEGSVWSCTKISGPPEVCAILNTEALESFISRGGAHNPRLPALGQGRTLENLGYLELGNVSSPVVAYVGLNLHTGWRAQAWCCNVVYTIVYCLFILNWEVSP